MNCLVLCQSPIVLSLHQVRDYHNWSLAVGHSKVSKPKSQVFCHEWVLCLRIDMTADNEKNSIRQKAHDIWTGWWQTLGSDSDREVPKQKLQKIEYNDTGNVGVPNSWIPLLKELVRTNRGPIPKEMSTGQVIKSRPFIDEKIKDQGYLFSMWQSWNVNSGSQNPDPGYLTTLLLPRVMLDLHV